MSALEITARHRVHGGELCYARHDSAATGTAMKLSVFLPPGEGPFPYVIWLSGLTCTEENFTAKAGAYGVAARLGLAIVAPDTSPRGEGVADDPAYDLGQGAGFYVDATQDPWAPHFQMETYVTRDLIAAVEAVLPLDGERRGVFGHSMGGHGALTLALRHPQLFRSVSAFAPIGSPTRCPWGEKAFTAYLGEDRGAWAAHDACLLIEAGVGEGRFDGILVDQGLADGFLETQLKPELLEAACRAAGQRLTLNRREGYDHSYFFITSFMAGHLDWHMKRLGKSRVNSRVPTALF
ncbi:S-formylglutathione hydrolase [Caulobacter ginsengisoli]|uniref:S-formylglutathione hydrolase n=1 Tax=Caulobacter ginsengisoli TaxID=400775 RepID=A0ABU0IK91_9CAUL|nr:S-formylglutathione hydrolase [Caulobacter ginsengisoli]MDQ0462430.1 S-formylglutathione hydrolase [Caulobacter ginsengisoli]